MILPIFLQTATLGLLHLLHALLRLFFFLYGSVEHLLGILTTHLRLLWLLLLLLLLIVFLLVLLLLVLFLLLVFLVLILLLLVLLVLLVLLLLILLLTFAHS